MALNRSLLGWSLLLALALGCAPFKAATPAGFVELPDQEPAYHYRASTHDGVVLAVRALKNDPLGDLTFWSEAIVLRLRQQGGYALLESKAVKTARGLEGRQLRFGHDQGTRPHLYYLTLFITDRIFVVEAGGAKDLVQREAARIDAFVSAFEAR